MDFFLRGEMLRWGWAVYSDIGEEVALVANMNGAPTGAERLAGDGI
jgi:hypothetical protein